MVTCSVLLVCEFIHVVLFMGAHTLWFFYGLSNALTVLNVPSVQPCEDTVTKGHYQIYLSLFACRIIYFEEMDTIPVLASVSRIKIDPLILFAIEP